LLKIKNVETNGIIMSQMFTNQDLSTVNKQSEVRAPKMMSKEYIKFIQQTLQGKVGMP
jgi:hypothetical protein